MDYFISWESGKKEREGGGMEDEGEEEGVCKLKNDRQRQRIWNEAPGMALSDLCFSVWPHSLWGRFHLVPGSSTGWWVRQ